MDLSLRLMPFQVDGVDFLAKSKRAMLSWEPGVGKTPPAVRACARVKAENVLVFCPLIATGVWRRHFLDWSGYADVRVLDGNWVQKPHAFLNGTGVRIIPYSRVSQKDEAVDLATRFSLKWDVVILDECHYLKNHDAKRTQVIYGPRIDLTSSPLEDAEHIWCLSGTPLLNGPHELWTHLKALRPDLITFPSLGVMSYRSFVNRYCHVRPTPYGFLVVGAKNTLELATRLKGFSDRKRTKDVLLDLPPLRIVTYELPGEMVTVTEEVEDALGDMSNEFGLLGDDEILAAMQSVHTSTARRLVGVAKVPGVNLLVNEMLESGTGKVIVFAHHREVVRQLESDNRAWNPLVIMGGTSQKDREHSIYAFQNDPAHRLIILSIEAASEAITLTAANQVVIAEPSPVPAKNAQAIARAHRKGQREAVLAQFVTLPGTFDAYFMNMLARKTRDIMKVVDPDLASPDPAQPTFPALEDQPI